MKIIPVEYIKKERGAALITALLILIMLTALGMAAIMTSSTETMISRNDYMARQAHYVADAGIQDAMARLDFGQITPDPNTANFATWKYTSYSSVGFLHYSVIVKYKIENDWGDNFHIYSSANNEVVKYNRAFQYSTAPTIGPTGGQPVYTIYSAGIMRAGGKTSKAVIIADCSENTLNLDVPGALYSKGCIDINGSVTIAGGTKASYVTGCGSAATVSGGAFTESGASHELGTMKNITGVNAFIGASLEQLRGMASDTGTYYRYSGGSWVNPPGQPSFPKDNYSFTSETNPRIYYLNTGGTTYTLGSNDNGYGILIVEGNLQMGGNAIWKGLVYVTGNFSTAAGTPQVFGGIMAGGDVTTTLSGSVTFQFDGTIMDKIQKQAFKQKLLSWRRYYQ